MSFVLVALVVALLISGNAVAQPNYQVTLSNPTLDIYAYEDCVLHAHLFASDGAGLLKGGAAYESLGGSICRLSLYIGGSTYITETADWEVGYIWITENQQNSFSGAYYSVIIDYPTSGD